MFETTEATIHVIGIDVAAELVNKLSARRDKWRTEAEYWKKVADRRKTKIKRLESDLRQARRGSYEVTGKHAANRHAEGPRTGAQSQGGKLHQCDSRATQDAQQCDHTPADQLIHPVVDGTCGKCWQVIDALKPHHEALNNPIPDWERELPETGQSPETTTDTDTPSGLLATIIDCADPDLTSDELAGMIQDAGFVSIHHNIASQIADWIGYQAEAVIEGGDIAECAAPVPGETGRAECVQARDTLYDAPAHWIHTVAGRIEKGQYL